MAATDQTEEKSTVSSEGIKIIERLEPVDLREAWPAEDGNFTPWLAENLDVLEKTLGIEMELEAQEKSVGRFSADILCKETSSDSWVLIENQLERTDHTHLGQLLTYAAGLETVTVIWIAKSFTDEHRAALDWLNGITDETFRFFGLEVELWRIGDSPVAPKLNIVSKPNDWSRSVSRAAVDGESSETQAKQKEYWEALNKVLDAAGGPIRGNLRPRPAHSMRYAIGSAGFSVNAVMQRLKGRIRTELYISGGDISGGDADAFFGLLLEKKDDIERQFGNQLDWQERPERRHCRIAHHLDDVNPMDEADWPRQHKWLAEQLNAMHRVFSDRVRDLDPDDWHATTEP